jgi:hypothetical protein
MIRVFRVDSRQIFSPCLPQSYHMGSSDHFSYNLRFGEEQPSLKFACTEGISLFYVDVVFWWHLIRCYKGEKPDA